MTDTEVIEAEPVNIEAARAAKAAENAATADPGAKALAEAEAQAVIEVREAEEAGSTDNDSMPMGERLAKAQGESNLIENANPMGVSTEELVSSVGQLTIQNSKLAEYATALRQEVVNLREDLKKAKNELATKQATIKNLVKQIK